MKRLSLNRHKTKDKSDHGKKCSEQSKISSFFDVFKTPEAGSSSSSGKKDIIENTPPRPEDPAVEDPGVKRRKLFKLKKQIVSSTTSLFQAGNLDKKASKVHTPPPAASLSKSDEAKKRPLTPESDT